MDLREAEDIKKRWQEYPEELYKKELYAGQEVTVELFKILKDDVVKVLHSNMPAHLENLAIVTGLEKVSFHSNPKERQCQRKFKLLASQ